MPLKLEYLDCFSSKASRKLRSLRPVFKRLKKVHEAFINNGPGDGPYWYGERPHIGLFAGAVWLCRGIALEEYGCHKVKHRESKTGRTDLWVGLKRTFIECEAKCVHLNLGGDTDVLAAKVVKGLDEALTDVKNLEGKEGLAFCFANLKVHKSKRSTMEPKRQDLIKKLLTNAHCHAVIWIGAFAGQKRVLWDNKRRYIHPGVILALGERWLHKSSRKSVADALA